ncbi:MAG: hypothetical protein D6707_05505 [Bacteroidetes bacterium]|nr:MAG: hypothetical protein D6707_05505 [Bacteroidota bacterium]
MFNKIKYTLILLFVFVLCSFGQTESKKKWSKYFSVNGYLKNMQTVSFTNADNLVGLHFLHNRFNAKFFLTKSITVNASMRNRLFYGEGVKNNPFFGKQTDVDNGLVDMSFLPVNEKALVMHTIFDRANVNFSLKKMDVTLGRQRINWGINVAWNPNDIFNTYNFINFDYEERPGSDAVYIEYYPTGMSSVNFAVKPAKNDSSWVAAMMYKFNKNLYDFQVLGGVYNQDFVLGGGWAGSIKNAIGFKGEASWFLPQQNTLDTATVLVSSVSFDYSFENSMYVNLSVYYNTQSFNQASLLALQNTSLQLTAKNLFPSQWAFFAQTSGNITPLINGSIALMYGTNSNLLFAMPSITYSISNNWDIMLLGQSYFGDFSGYKNLGNSIFLRLKWSF